MSLMSSLHHFIQFISWRELQQTGAMLHQPMTEEAVLIFP